MCVEISISNHKRFLFLSSLPISFQTSKFIHSKPRHAYFFATSPLNSEKMSLLKILTPPSRFFPSLLLPRNVPLKFSLSTIKHVSSNSSSSSSHIEEAEEEHVNDSRLKTITKRWKPMCLYFTQGKCTMMGDASHLEKFNHNISADLEVNASKLSNLRTQDFDYILVLDLEGKVEILEFPVVMIDTKTMQFIDSFHRFVKPTEMSEKRINEYIEGKYGKFGVDRVWHDTSIPFKDALQEFELWLNAHNLWNNKDGGFLNRAAFVTCGNWDIKTKIPEQCKVSKIKLPLYFMEWINLKDVYLNFYNRRATGMMTMMRELHIQVMGSHHLGIDDSKNIARVVQRLLSDGALLQLTAKRSSSDPGNVKFLFENRIR